MLMLFLFSLSQNSPATLIALCYQTVRPKMVVTIKMLLLDQVNHQHSSRDMLCVEVCLDSYFLWRGCF